LAGDPMTEGTNQNDLNGFEKPSELRSERDTPPKTNVEVKKPKD